MYRLIGILFVIALCVAIACFYFGVLRIGSDSAGGLTHITLTWDRTKMQEDEKKATDKVHDVTHQEKEKVD
jgi:hypothetical protein